MKHVLFTLLLVLLAGVSAFAQGGDRVISGIVTDIGDMGLPGVNVVVKGTSIGTITNFDGEYSITVPGDAEKIIYSFIGFKTQVIDIGSSNTVNLVMLEDVEALDEVVVVGVGVPRSQKKVGYATQKVDGADLAEARESNVVNSMSGRIAGVQVTGSSGAVGASSRILLRGASSIYGNNQPLFIVDGVPMSNASTGSATGSGGFDVPNGVADINPKDIESVDVLKGPNAAAIYGIRAANGVVVITTKKGNKNKALGVDIGSSVTFETPLVLPDYQNSYGQGASSNYFEYTNGSNFTTGDAVDESWGPPLDRGLEFIQFTSFINNPDDPQPEPWISYPDNVRDFYETGITNNNDISLSGGNELTNFRLGVGYTQQKGMIPSTDFEKFSVSGRGSHQFTDKLSAKFGVNFIKSESDNLPSNGYDGANVVQQTVWAGRQVDFQALKDYKNLPKALPGSTFGGDEGLPINWNTEYQNNPYWQLANNTNSFDRNRTIGNFGLVYKLTDFLSVAGNIGADSYTTKTSVRLAKGSAADAPTSARFGGNRIGADGYYDEDVRTFFETNMDLNFMVEAPLGENLSLAASVGGNRMHRTTTFDFRAIQLDLPGLYNLNNLAPGTTLFNRNNHGQSAINSLFGSAELGFRNYLFLNVTGRQDWASVLPTANNSFFYPSVTLSLVLSEMLDFSDNVDFLKVFGGWAEVGGFGPLGPGDIIPTYLLSSTPWNGNVFGNFPSTLNNPNIQSQTTTGFEGGIDTKLFLNRVRFTATYYDQTSKDLVLPVQVSTSSGVSSVWDNVGELRNRGIELQLGSTVLDRNDFSIDVDFNFAKNNNEVISVSKASEQGATTDEDVEETIILGSTWNMNLEAREGYPYGVIVGTSLARDNNGSVIYENGLPVVGDIKVLGDIQPDWTGGVNVGMRYKNITFNTLVDAKIGGDVYSMTSAWGRFAGILSETLAGRETGIIGNGVMNVGSDDEPQYVTNNIVVDAEAFNKGSYGNDIVETSVFDASFVKLRQIAIGINVPNRLLADVGIQNVNFSIVGRNLAILHRKAPHIDPETSYSNSNGNQGQEFGQLPSARSVGVSVNLQF